MIRKNRPLAFVLLSLTLLLAGCFGTTSEPEGTPPAPAPTATLPPATEAPAPPPPTGTPTPAPEPAGTPAAALSAPTETPPSPTLAPTATEIADWSDYESVTPSGYYERGNPEAPILILDYSDFL